MDYKIIPCFCWNRVSFRTHNSSKNVQIEHSVWRQRSWIRHFIALFFNKDKSLTRSRSTAPWCVVWGLSRGMTMGDGHSIKVMGWVFVKVLTFIKRHASNNKNQNNEYLHYWESANIQKKIVNYH